MKMEQIECSETSAYNNQTPGKHPKEYIQDSKHGKSLKSRILLRSYVRVERMQNQRMPKQIATVTMEEIRKKGRPYNKTERWD